MFAVTLEGEADLLKMQRTFAAEVWRGSRTAVEAACAAGVDEAKRVGSFKDHSGSNGLRARVHWLLLRTADIEIEGEMRSLADYSSFVEGGTAPHPIWPKEGEGVIGPMRRGQSRRDKSDIGTHRVALRWYDGGGAVRFARMVNHPGSRPYPFMGPAYQAAERTLSARLEAEIARVTARLSS